MVENIILTSCSDKLRSVYTSPSILVICVNKMEPWPGQINVVLSCSNDMLLTTLLHDLTDIYLDATMCTHCSLSTCGVLLAFIAAFVIYMPVIKQLFHTYLHFQHNKDLEISS